MIELALSILSFFVIVGIVFSLVCGLLWLLGKVCQASKPLSPEVIANVLARR